MTDMEDLDDAAGGRRKRLDRWDRYKILPPHGSKPIGYTRASTIAKTLEDQTSLVNWRVRMTMGGLAARPDLLARTAVAFSTDDRDTLNAIAESALEAAGGADRREIGTALHHAVSASITGKPVPKMFENDVKAFHDLLTKYGLKIDAQHSERVVVNDTLGVAGTFDFILEDYHGRLYIADLKTGSSVQYSHLSFSIQLAIYAYADSFYIQGDAENGSEDEREPMVDVDKETAFIIHLQPESGHADLYAVDIGRGWQLVELAMAVRNCRKYKDLLVPATSWPDAPALVYDDETKIPKIPINITHRANPIDPNDVVRVAWIKQRINDLSDEARSWLASHWPENIATPKTAERYSDADIEQIERVLNHVESETEAQLPDGDPAIVNATKESPPVNEPIDLPPADPPAPPDVIERLEAAHAALGPTGRGMLHAWLDRVRGAGGTVSARRNAHTAARGELLVYAAAHELDTDFLMAACDAEPNTDLGEFLVGLRAETCYTALDRLQVVVAGKAHLAYNFEGTPTIIYRPPLTLIVNDTETGE